MTTEQLAEDVQWFSDRGYTVTLDRTAFEWVIGTIDLETVTLHVHATELADGFARLRALAERTAA